MSVVLRCPTCGTTQGHAGECDACSDGEVRFFCSNHQGGVWLEGPVCSRCGAKFGDAAPRRHVPIPPTGPSRPSGAPDFSAPKRRRVPGRPPAAGSGASPDGRRDSDAREEPEVLPRTPLEALLAEITEGRARSHRPYEPEEVTWAEPPARRPGIPVAGCLLRIVTLVFLLIAAIIVFMFLLFGGFLVN